MALAGRLPLPLHDYNKEIEQNSPIDRRRLDKITPSDTYNVFKFRISVIQLTC